MIAFSHSEASVAVLYLKFLEIFNSLKNSINVEFNKNSVMNPKYCKDNFATSRSAVLISVPPLTFLEAYGTLLNVVKFNTYSESINYSEILY